MLIYFTLLLTCCPIFNVLFTHRMCASWSSGIFCVSRKHSVFKRTEVILMKGRHINTIYYEVKITQTKDEIILLKLTRALLASGSAGLQGAINSSSIIHLTSEEFKTIFPKYSTVAHSRIPGDPEHPRRAHHWGGGRRINETKKSEGRVTKERVEPTETFTSTG